MLGLHYKKVEMIAYQSEWRKYYEIEREIILGALGELVKGIEHIGSTAIIGILAKPIIDIVVGLDDIEKVGDCIMPLSENGYNHLGEGKVPGRHFFVKGNRSCTTHHLHITTWNSNVWRQHIDFRNFLRGNSEKMEEYAQLKRQLAIEYFNDRDAYAEGKAKWISQILTSLH